jgi:hypothetical protein
VQTKTPLPAGVPVRLSDRNPNREATFAISDTNKDETDKGSTGRSSDGPQDSIRRAARVTGARLSCVVGDEGSKRWPLNQAARKCHHRQRVGG